MTHRLRSEAGYQGWRASVIWTDAQILAALDEEIAEIEAGGKAYLATRVRYVRDKFACDGRLSGWLLGQAMPRLIKICALCGKTALYRRGAEGRCRTHRDVPERFSAARAARAQRSQADLDQRLTAVDRAQKAREQHRRFVAARGKRLK